MRSRALVAVVLLLLPTVASAQRIPWPLTRRGAERPSPIPPQAPVIARELSYARMPYSVESYPLISTFRSSRVDAGVSSWTSGGIGTRVDFRLSRYVSATADLTTSFIGGPAITETFEVGTRLRPERNERRLYPFMDVRAGYVRSHFSYGQQSVLADPYSPGAYGWSSTFSHGLGGVGGVGMEYALTRRFSLTGAASVMRSQLTTYSFRGDAPTAGEFWMTSYRYTLGLRYNPVRMLWRPDAGLPSSSIPAR